jgi:transposase-like protein
MTSSYVKNQAVRSFYQVFISGLDTKVTEFLQELFNVMIYSEFEQYLGRKKYERSKKFTYKEYMNGSRERTILFKWSGMLRIKIPRVRKGRFVPRIVFGNLTDPSIEKLLLQLWAQGCSYRDIKHLVGSLYGTDISTKLVNRIVNSVEKFVKQFHANQIEHKYECLYADAICLKVKTNEGKCSKAVVLELFGQRKCGKKVIKEMIDYMPAEAEDDNSYTAFFKSLKQRGLKAEKINLIVHDDHAAISKAIKNVYAKSKIPQQLCLVHKMRNVIAEVKHKVNIEPLKKRIWEVYSAKSKPAFLKLHKKLMKEYYEKEPEAMRIFGKIDDKLLTKFDFPKLKKIDIKTNNPVERYNRELKRRTKAIGCFESLQSIDNLMFLIIEYLNQCNGASPTDPELKFTH